MIQRATFLRILVVLGGIGLAQFTGYCLCSRQAMVETVAPFLPSPSRCPVVCLNNTYGLPPQQRKSLERLMRGRYSEVYGSLDDVLSSPSLKDLDRVCVINWNRRASGIFWYQASYSGESASNIIAGVEETYVWVLFKWVMVHQRLTVDQSGVVVSAA